MMAHLRKTINVIIFLLFLVCDSTSQISSPPKPPKLQLSVERKVDDHIYTIKVDVNHTPLDLVIDTASPFLWVANKSLTNSQFYDPPGYDGSACNYCSAQYPITHYGYNMSVTELLYHNWQNLASPCRCPTSACQCSHTSINYNHSSANVPSCSCNPKYTLLYEVGNISGYVATDQISIGPHKTDNYRFGVAMADSTLLSAFVSGSFGVGFNHNELNDFVPPLDALFPGVSGVFSIYLGKCPALLLGPSANWSPLYYDHRKMIEIPLTDKYQFMIRVNNIGFGNDGNFSKSSKAKVLIDSGTSFLVAPGHFDLDKAINQSFNCENCVFKSTKWMGLWEINPQKIAPKDMPVLSIFYGNHPNERWDLEWCYYIFTEKDGNNDTHYIIGISTLSNIDFWILGDMFISKYFVTFDKRNYKLNIAPAHGRVPITHPRKYCKDNYDNCKGCRCDKFGKDEDICDSESVFDAEQGKDPCFPKQYND